jgi:hypothetical protein
MRVPTEIHEEVMQVSALLQELSRESDDSK